MIFKLFGLVQIWNCSEYEIISISVSMSPLSLSLSHFVPLSFHISSVSPSLCLCVPSSTSHFVSPSPSLFAPVYSSPTSCVSVSSSPSVYFSSVSPSVCLSSVSPSACFSNCLFVYLSFSPFIHLSLRFLSLQFSNLSVSPILQFFISLSLPLLHFYFEYRTIYYRHCINTADAYFTATPKHLHNLHNDRYQNESGPLS